MVSHLKINLANINLVISDEKVVLSIISSTGGSKNRRKSITSYSTRLLSDNGSEIKVINNSELQKGSSEKVLTASIRFLNLTLEKAEGEKLFRLISF